MSGDSLSDRVEELTGKLKDNKSISLVREIVNDERSFGFVDMILSLPLGIGFRSAVSLLQGKLGDQENSESCDHSVNQPYTVALEQVKRLDLSNPSVYDVLTPLVDGSEISYVGSQRGIYYFVYCMHHVLGNIDFSDDTMVDLAKLTTRTRANYENVGSILSGLKEFDLSNKDSTGLIRKLIKNSYKDYTLRLGNTIRLIGTELSKPEKKGYLDIARMLYPKFRRSLERPHDFENVPYLRFINLVSKLDANQRLVEFVRRFFDEVPNLNPVSQGKDDLSENFDANLKPTNLYFLYPLTELTNISNNSMSILSHLVIDRKAYTFKYWESGMLMSVVETLNHIEDLPFKYYSLIDLVVLGKKSFKFHYSRGSVAKFLKSLRERVLREVGPDDEDDYLKRKVLTSRYLSDVDFYSRFHKAFFSDLGRAVKRSSIPLDLTPIFAIYWYNRSSNHFLYRYEISDGPIERKRDGIYVISRDSLGDTPKSRLKDIHTKLHDLYPGLGLFCGDLLNDIFTRSEDFEKDSSCDVFSHFFEFVSYASGLREQEERGFLDCLKFVPTPIVDNINESTEHEYYELLLKFGFGGKIKKLKKNINLKWDLLENTIRQFCDLYRDNTLFADGLFNYMVETAKSLLDLDPEVGVRSLQTMVSFYTTDYTTGKRWDVGMLHNSFLYNYKDLILNLVNKSKTSQGIKIEGTLSFLLDHTKSEEIYANVMNAAWRYMVKGSRRSLPVDEPEFWVAGPKAEAQREAIKGYPNYGVETDLLKNKSGEIVTKIKSEAGGGDKFYIVDFGCGDGLKDVVMIDQALEQYANVEVCLVDASGEMLDTAEKNLQRELGENKTRVKIKKVQSTFEDLKKGNEVYDNFKSSADENILYQFLGTTWCNFDLDDITEIMHEITGKHVLFGIYTYEDGNDGLTLESYDTKKMSELSYYALTNVGFSDNPDDYSLKYRVKLEKERYKDYGPLAKVVTFFEFLDPVEVSRVRYSREDLVPGAMSIKPTDKQVYKILGKHFDIKKNYIGEVDGQKTNVHLYLAENKA